jgi:hypothetical protein
MQDPVPVCADLVPPRLDLPPGVLLRTLRNGDKLRLIGDGGDNEGNQWWMGWCNYATTSRDDFFIHIVDTPYTILETESP